MNLFPRRAWCCRAVAGPERRLSGMAGSVCVGLMMLLAMRAMAAVHPVPLAKDTDPKKCLECHDDKTKHKFVHSAMQMGLPELPRNQGEQGRDACEADHGHAGCALHQLPCGQEGCGHQGDGASAGGARLPDVP